jgi:hypothetical protein
VQFPKRCVVLLCLLEYWAMDKFRNPSNPVLYTIVKTLTTYKYNVSGRIHRPVSEMILSPSSGSMYSELVLHPDARSCLPREFIVTYLLSYLRS